MSSSDSGSEEFTRSAQQRRNFALLLLIIGGVSIGASPILVRYSELGPLASAFWRVLFALAPLIITSRILRPGIGIFKEVRSVRDFIAAGFPGIFLACDLMCWHTSLHLTTVTNSTLLVNTSPIFVALGGWMFLKQNISRGLVLGLACALSGILFLKGGLPTFEDKNLAGDLMALVAALFLTGYMISMTSARKRFSTLTLMICTSAVTTATIFPVAFMMEDRFIPQTVSGWQIVIAMGLISHALGQGLIAYSLAWLPAAFSSLTLLIQPVIAAVLAIFLLNESLTAIQVAGGGLVILGILIAQRSYSVPANCRPLEPANELIS